MLAKSRISTQLAYMKLLVVLVILICTNVVVANSTSEPVEHRRHLSAAAGFRLWSNVPMSFEDKWKKAFRDHARKHFADNKKYSMKGDELDTAWKKTKSLSSDDAFFSLKLHKLKINLLRRAAYIRWANNISPDMGAQAKETLQVLFKEVKLDIISVVNIINAGKMLDISSIRDLATEMESQLVNQLKDKSLGDLFKSLKLNKMKSEMKLYANPAFTTWMQVAILKEGDQTRAFNSMLAVLKEEKKNSNGFKGLLEVAADTEEEKKLFENWELVHKTHSSWHQVLKADA